VIGRGKTHSSAEEYETKVAVGVYRKLMIEGSKRLKPKFDIAPQLAITFMFIVVIVTVSLLRFILVTNSADVVCFTTGSNVHTVARYAHSFSGIMVVQQIGFLSDWDPYAVISLEAVAYS